MRVRSQGAKDADEMSGFHVVVDSKRKNTEESSGTVGQGIGEGDQVAGGVVDERGKSREPDLAQRKRLRRATASALNRSPVGAVSEFIQPFRSSGGRIPAALAARADIP